jgi:ribosome-binding protein aMBF1 (putative translation factor)
MTIDPLAALLREQGWGPESNVCGSCGHDGGDHDLGNWCLICPRPEATTMGPFFSDRIAAGWDYFASMTEAQKWDRSIARLIAAGVTLTPAIDAELRAIDLMLTVTHRDDLPCACDDCMDYGAEDAGADWARIPAANRIVMRILDSGDDRLAPLVEAFRNHESAAVEDRAAPDGLPFHAHVREARRNEGMTLRALADAVDADFTYLSKVEHGHDRPSRDLAERLDTALVTDGSILSAFDALGCPKCGAALAAALAPKEPDHDRR